MKIEYLGHACFRIDGSLVIDPYKDGSVPGLPPLRTQAVKVICSHEHADHSGRECVEIIPGECGLNVEEIPCYHDDKQGALRGPNKIFVVTAPTGEKLVHLGDLGHLLDESILKRIRGADYLLVPVGGYYTIDASAAAEVCKAAMPKCVVPMHYRTATSGYPELNTVDEFVKLADEAGLSIKVM